MRAPPVRFQAALVMSPEPTQSRTSPAACGRVRLAELPAQELAQLAEWPAVACGIERRRLGGAEGAEVGGELLTPQEPLDGRRVEARLRPLGVRGQGLPDLRRIPAQGQTPEARVPGEA